MFKNAGSTVDSSHRRIFRWLALAAGWLFLTFSAADAGPTAGASVVVKFRDGVIAAGSTALPPSVTQELGVAFGTGFTVTGFTRDGALQIALDNPSLDAARAGLYRMRENADVLYANVARVAPVADYSTTQKSAQALPPVRGLIVKYKDARVQASFSGGGSTAAQEIARISNLAQQPVAYQRTLGVGAGLFLFMQRIPDAQAQVIAEALQADPAIEYADPDRLMFPLLIPNDPAWPSQWDLMIPSVEIGGANLPPAWDITTGSASINIAIIDTGILPHPDLAGRYTGGLDFIVDWVVANDGQPPQSVACMTGVPGPFNPFTDPNCVSSRDGDASDPGDWLTSADNAGTTFSGWLMNCGVSNSSFHGTHVAGEIGAATNNSIGVAGINWHSMMIPLSVLGKCGGYTSDIADAITWSVNGAVPGLPANPNPAKVVNMSLGGMASCAKVTQNAINTALAAGATVVVAAGNSNNDASLFTPASCNGVITVAATQRQGLKAYYSNFGSTVEIAGPGGGQRAPPNQATYDLILSTLNSGTTSPDLTPAGWNYVGYQGTSMATPHVVGVVSLMYSVNPSITPAQVLNKLQVTSRAFPAGNACGMQDPNNSATWFSCVCTTATCGAGMLDAYRAVLATIGAPTVTTLTIVPDPVSFGNTVTFTAATSGIVPGGSVTFRDGSTTLGSVPVATMGDLATAQFTTSSLPIGGHVITATYSGDSNNNTSASFPLTANVWSPLGTRKRDLNGDAKSDLLWMNTGGLLYEWLMNGASYSAVSIGVPGSTVAGFGDVSGEGRASIVYFNAATTQVFVWRMSGGGALGVYSLGSVGSGWSIKGIGDVNGDGFADIIWQHTNGTVVAWLMHWTGTTFTYTVRNYGVVGAGWSIAGVGDLDGDGVEDIVWFYAPTNTAYVWLMNAGGIKQVAGIGSVSPGWTIQKVADFDGDGHADLFWRNGASNAIWYMNGATVAQVDLPPVVGSTWSIVGAGDWDSDNKYDLMWREAGGIVYEWKMNGRGVAPTPIGVGFIDSTWTSVGQ